MESTNLFAGLPRPLLGALPDAATLFYFLSLGAGVQSSTLCGV